MSKPKPFYVSYVSNPAAPPERWKERERDADTLEEAREIGKRLLARSPMCLPVVYERIDIEDVTPKGDGHGLLWNWVDTWLEEVE